jgi:hypothetical protein
VEENPVAIIQTKETLKPQTGEMDNDRKNQQLQLLQPNSAYIVIGSGKADDLSKDPNNYDLCVDCCIWLGRQVLYW